MLVPWIDEAENTTNNPLGTYQKYIPQEFM